MSHFSVHHITPTMAKSMPFLCSATKTPAVMRSKSSMVSSTAILGTDEFPASGVKMSPLSADHSHSPSMTPAEEPPKGSGSIQLPNCGPLKSGNHVALSILA